MPDLTTRARGHRLDHKMANRLCYSALFLLATAACTPGTTPMAVDAQNGADSGSIASSSDTAISPNTADVDGKSKPETTSWGSGGKGCATIDFPCGYTSECASETDYAGFKTIGCAEAGYDPSCCSGETCKPAGGGTCPTGQLCAQAPTPPDWSAPCQTPNCAGDTDCSGGRFCLKPRGQCQTAGKIGVCTAKIEYGGSNSLDDSEKLCGCDGKTYEGFGAILAATVSVDHAGYCCDPAKMPFGKDNPMGFSEIEVCGGTPDFQVCSGAGAAPWSLCPPGGNSCFVSVPPAVTGTTLSDADWNDLCSAVSAGNKAYGVGGPNCKGPLAPTPTCAKGCQDPCGCNPCAVSGFACNGDNFRQCTDGCTNDFVCGDGLTCTQLTWGAVCAGTCDGIQAAAKAQLPAWQKCATDADCVPRLARCALPGCFVVVNKAHTQDELDVRFNAWGYKGCGGCDCAGKVAPKAKCIGGVCGG